MENNVTQEAKIDDAPSEIEPLRVPRQGWEEQFRCMAATGDDKLLDADVPSLTTWDEAEWVW